MATQTDFWGDIQKAEIRMPATIMREQAALLGTKTGNTVEANVQTFVRHGNFYHTFNLVVPSMDNYTYELFRVHHGMDVYPVSFSDSKNNLTFNTEGEFTEWLRQRLSSPETKRIVARLYSLASS